MTSQSACLADDGIHVWAASLALDGSEYRRLLDTLAADERERARDFVFDHDRRQFVAARGVLRAILGRYLGLAPDRLRFRLGPLGKPALVDHSLRFSVSHSGDLALFAVSRGSEVGVDLERVRPVADLDRIVERYFSSRERQTFCRFPRDRKEEAFFRGWTRKEAWLKARGEGLAGPVELDPQCEGRWCVRSIAAAPGHVAALAAEWQPGGERHIEYWQWPDGVDVV